MLASLSSALRSVIAIRLALSDTSHATRFGFWIAADSRRRTRSGGRWQSGTRHSSSQLLNFEEETFGDQRTQHEPPLEHPREWQRGKRTREFNRPRYRRLFARPSRSAPGDTR